MGVTIQDIRVICTAPEGINLVVIKVETNQPGLYGLGCGTFAYRHLLVKQVVEEYLKPLLVGRNAENIEELWQLMHQNAYWRNGPVENNAISGVDMALWDIKGKLAGMPCYQLFGGKCREGIPVYRHVDGKDLSEICENIQRYQEMGVNAAVTAVAAMERPPARLLRERPTVFTWIPGDTSGIRSNSSREFAIGLDMTSLWCMMFTSELLRWKQSAWPRNWSHMICSSWRILFPWSRRSG